MRSKKKEAKNNDNHDIFADETEIRTQNTIHNSNSQRKQLSASVKIKDFN